MSEIKCSILKSGTYTPASFWDKDAEVEGVFLDMYVEIPNQKEVTNDIENKYQQLFKTSPELLEKAENFINTLENSSNRQVIDNQKRILKEVIQKAKGEPDG